jgi:hypothetical protein
LESARSSSASTPAGTSRGGAHSAKEGGGTNICCEKISATLRPLKGGAPEEELVEDDPHGVHV